MKQTSAPFLIRALPLSAALLLSACATRAPDFGGRWRDANRYAETTRAIPLQQAHVYAPSPADGTLRNMLQRWARDAGFRLRYEHASDYTLFAGVAGIRTSDLRQAAEQLDAVYAAQGIDIMAADNELVVRPVAAGTPATR